MTGIQPAALLFNGRKYATNLPMIRKEENTEEQQKARVTDAERKEKMKIQADKKANVHVQNRLLLKQKKINKWSTPYKPEPYFAVEV